MKDGIEETSSGRGQTTWTLWAAVLLVVGCAVVALTGEPPLPAISGIVGLLAVVWIAWRRTGPGHRIGRGPALLLDAGAFAAIAGVVSSLLWLLGTGVVLLAVGAIWGYLGGSGKGSD